MEKLEHIGMGSEKDVYSDASDPDKKVIMEYRQRLTERQIKGTYYINKIIHLLFPSNVPDVHIAGNNNGISYINAERIPHDEKHAVTQRTAIQFSNYVNNYPNGGEKPSEEQQDLAREYDLDKESDPRVQAFIQRMREAGISPDPAGQNYSFDENGEVKYLDMGTGWYFPEYGGSPELSGCLKIEKIIEAINELAPEKKREAEAYLDRFLVLLEEEGRQ